MNHKAISSILLPQKSDFLSPHLTLPFQEDRPMREKISELQSSDPEALAKRWSAIANMPLQTDETGRLEMRLSNASIRFVEEADGRGEGLSGIDIEAVDPE